MSTSVDFDRLPLGRATLDRAAFHRVDPDWQVAAWANPRSRVLLIAGTSTLVSAQGELPALHFVAPADAPAGERFFLGIDDAGVGFYAVVVDELPQVADRRPGELRELGPLLGDRDAGLLVTACSLGNWHATHRYCGRCGAATVVATSGWTRTCPVDGSEHYPRTDPAVIMTIVDADDRVLLGRQAQWPPRRFSALAGFVEAGETLEQAVRREVLEESGVRVGEVRYLGNQPWPFPCSLMLGFWGRGESTDVVPDDELEEARWYSREELAADLADGNLLLPGRASIARRLIEHWYGAELPDPV